MLFNKKLIILFLFQTGLYGALFAQMGWTIYNTENSLLESNQINCLSLYENTLWVGTSFGLYSFENDNWLNHSSNLPNQNVKCISFNNSGKMFVGTTGGMSVCDSGLWESYTNINSILSSQINDITFHLEETYIATISGLFKIGKDISLVLDSSSLESMFINVQSITSIGDSLAVGTMNGGLGYLYNGNMIWHNTSTSAISDNTSVDIAIDDDKNLWLAAPYGGLISHLNNNGWVNYNTFSNEGWPSNSLNTILIDDEYFMFIGSNGAGFFRFYYINGVPTTVIYNTSNSGVPNNNVLSLIKGSGDVYWLGTENGLVKWETTVGVNTFNKTAVLFNNYVVNKLSLSKKSDIDLYNLKGQVMCSVNNKKNIDLSYLESGMYVLRLNEKSHIIIKE